MHNIKSFLTDPSGAITVEWVVLTAAIVGLMFASLSLFFGGITDHADVTAAELSSMQVVDQYQ